MHQLFENTRAYVRSPRYPYRREPRDWFLYRDFMIYHNERLGAWTIVRAGKILGSAASPQAAKQLVEQRSTAPEGLRAG
jgi:hypothetical protein